MKTFKIVGVLFFIFCLFVMPVSAFEDDFNDDSIIDWTVVSGVWYTKNSSSIDGADDYYLYADTTKVGGGTETETIYKAVSDGDNDYISFNFKISNSFTQSVIYSNSYFRFNDDGSSYNGLYVYLLGTGTTAYLRGDGFSYTEVSISKNVWYEVTIEIDGNTAVITLYDVNGAQIDQQTISYTPISNPDRITVSNAVIGQTGETGTTYFSIDNIYTSALSPSTVSGITWNEDQYIEGDTASYSWVLENSFWQDLIYKYRIQILKDGVEIDTVKVAQAGTRYQDVDTAGTYEVKLQYSGLWPTNWQSIDSDSVNVIPRVDSYINVPQTAPQRTNFTVTYLYGSTPSNGLILMKRLDDTTGIYETVEFDLLDGDKQGGTTYSRNMSLHSTGTYKITLIHDEQVDEIYDVIEITSLYVPPIETVGNSSISSDKSSYAIGETIFAQYAVDYTNFTTYNVNMEIYNIDKDIVSYSIPTIDQISYISQTIPITNEFFTGAHHLRLTSYDNTGTKVDVLTSKNITIGLVNDGGFGLSLSKYDVMQLEMFVIKAISPTSANIRVWSVERDVQAGSLITINGSTYLNYAIPLAGNYEITLSSGGFEIATQYITVHEGFVDGEVDDEIEDEVTQSTINMVIMFLSMPAFWGMIIWVGVVGGVAQSNAVNRSSTGYIAFALGNILAVVGMFAPYTMYILVILWIGAGVFFKLGREAAGSEEY